MSEARQIKMPKGILSKSAELVLTALTFIIGSTFFAPIPFLIILSSAAIIAFLFIRKNILFVVTGLSIYVITQIIALVKSIKDLSLSGDNGGIIFLKITPNVAEIIIYIVLTLFLMLEFIRKYVLLSRFDKLFSIALYSLMITRVLFSIIGSSIFVAFPLLILRILTAITSLWSTSKLIDWVKNPYIKNTPSSKYISKGIVTILSIVFAPIIGSLYLVFKMSRYAKLAKSKKTPKPFVSLLLFMFVPFYYFYWNYQTAQCIDEIGKVHNIKFNIAGLCLLLTFLCPIITPVIMQIKINKIYKAEVALLSGNIDEIKQLKKSNATSPIET